MLSSCPSCSCIRGVNARRSTDGLKAVWTNLWWSIILWAYRFWQSRVWKQISLSDPWCQRVPVGTTACLISPSILLLFLVFHVFPNRNNCRLRDSLLYFYPWHLLASFIVFLHVFHMFDLVFKRLKTSYAESLSAAMRIKDLGYI